MTETARTVTTTDGRSLDVLVAGVPDGPLVMSLHGTPQGHDLLPELVAAAEQHGLRIATYARPGYAGSTRRPGRTVADAVPDVLAVVDALGAVDFAVVGASGGGPHALACGALAADRCAAVATLAGVGPWEMDDLRFLAGMGEGNEIEFAAALEGEGPLRALLVPWREQMVDGGPEGTYAGMESVLSPPDREVFDGEHAAQLHASAVLAMREGVDGWVDDDLAFLRPWGFTPADRGRHGAGLPLAGRAGPHGAARARPLARRCPAHLPAAVPARRRPSHPGDPSCAGGAGRPGGGAGLTACGPGAMLRS